MEDEIRIWSIRKVIRTWKIRGVRKEITLSTTIPTWTSLGSNPNLRLLGMWKYTRTDIQEGISVFHAAQKEVMWIKVRIYIYIPVVRTSVLRDQPRARYRDEAPTSRTWKQRMSLRGKREKFGENPAPVPPSPPQITHVHDMHTKMC